MPGTAQKAYAGMVNQNFTMMDRGDMFVPAGTVEAPLGVGAFLTARMGPMKAAAVPFSYNHPTANARVRAFGAQTPASPIKG